MEIRTVDKALARGRIILNATEALKESEKIEERRRLRLLQKEMIKR